MHISPQRTCPLVKDVGFAKIKALHLWDTFTSVIISWLEKRDIFQTFEYIDPSLLKDDVTAIRNLLNEECYQEDTN